MTWKHAFHRAVEKELQPMRQITHWVLFLACGVTFAMKTIEGASAASYEMILAHPDIANSSWLLHGFF